MCFQNWKNCSETLEKKGALYVCTSLHLLNFNFQEKRQRTDLQKPQDPKNLQRKHQHQAKRWCGLQKERNIFPLFSSSDFQFFKLTARSWIVGQLYRPVEIMNFYLFFLCVSNISNILLLSRSPPVFRTRVRYLHSLGSGCESSV